MNASPILAFLLVSTLFCCKNNDQILGNRVAGQWVLTQIRYANPNRPGTDTTLLLQGASITFDACQYKRGESLTCSGRHEVFSKSLVPFQFDIDGLNQTSMSIRQQYDQYSPRIGDLDLNGTYALAFADNDNQMELKGRYYLFGGKNILDETAYFMLRRKQ